MPCARVQLSERDAGIGDGEWKEWSMTVAREMMTRGADCVRTDQTAADAALVTKIVAQGRDAGTFPAGDLNQDEAVTVGADDPAEEVLATMTRHKVRRLPVIDQDRLVGMISLGDVARQLPHSEVGELVDALSAD